MGTTEPRQLARLGPIGTSFDVLKLNRLVVFAGAQRNARQSRGYREYVKLRIRQSFRIKGARAGVSSPAEVFRVGWIDKPDLDAAGLQRVGEQIPRAAVEIG